MIDQLFIVRQVLRKKWEYCGVMLPLFVDFKKANQKYKMNLTEINQKVCLCDSLKVYFLSIRLP